MGDKKKAKKEFTDFAAAWGWPADKEESKKQWKDFRSNVETFFDQLQDIQKPIDQNLSVFRFGKTGTYGIGYQRVDAVFNFHSCTSISTPP